MFITPSFKKSLIVEQFQGNYLKEFHRRKFEKSDKDFSLFSPQWQLRHQNRNSPRSPCEHARIFEPRSFVDERLDNGGLIKIHTGPLSPNRFLFVFFQMTSLFLLLGCNLSYIVDLFAALHELASASARTLLKLASSVRALLKPYGDTLNYTHAKAILMASTPL